MLPADVERIYVRPSGWLWRIPWAALPIGDGKRLVEKCAVSVTPSLFFLQPEKDRKFSNRVLVAGGIDFGAAPPPALPRWAPLSGTKREADQIVKLVDGERTVLVQGRAATPERLSKELSDAGWIHLATHGFVRDGDAEYEDDLLHRESLPFLDVGLVLAGANRERGAGVLTGEAVAGMSLNARVAVLSACQTGVGEMAYGDGVFGLQQAFHLAGARNVVSSLWKVDDQATAAFMESFYTYVWRDKLTPLDAFRKTQLDLLRGPKAAKLASSLRGPIVQRIERVDLKNGQLPIYLWAGFQFSGRGGE